MVLVSCCIGISKSILRGVPVVWDDGNTQIREMWEPYGSAMPLYGKPDRRKLAAVVERLPSDAKRLREGIRESWDSFVSFLGGEGFRS